MPNLSPKDARRKYELYNNKISTGAESSEGLNRLAEQMQSIGYQLSDGRGDHPSFQQL
jgi:biotin synthase